MQPPYDLLDPMFLATRETFPGERSFHDLARAFFSRETAEERAAAIAALWDGDGALVHMANPEQLDDLFAHVARETRVRYLSTTYLQRGIRTSVYAIGRGTGLILDPARVRVEHVSVNDCMSETDHLGRLEAKDDLRVADVAALRAALLERPRDDWNEVNVSFEGPSPVLGFFALDGVMSKLYATALRIKSGGLLPVFAYNRQANRLAEFVPTPEGVRALADLAPGPHLRERFRSLAAIVEDEKIPA
jgi:hypothetical protein